ncbi:hypothetical protein FQV37_196 [Psychrobacter nivimaris]|uniref:Uncharacterized protein n=1 Tax=Psychrobacter nivimaris TaxID=281738 RepID=A0A6N7C1N2_9GAMM|nr:hypothetical protein [Psychrobacter nivimaris]KAF0569201.1 hypothetical protein FQV37_196 [Psychrobacter nivimaris]
MLKIKFWQLWWACIAALAASYPISAWAADQLIEARVLPAPFLLSWTGVWVFSTAGGLCAAFVKIPEIDKSFYYPSLAKALIGVFMGVALSLAVNTFNESQSGALPLFALLAGLFSAPLVAGTMVWISNQKRINKTLNQAVRNRTGLDTSVDADFQIDTAYKKGDSDDSANLS